MERTRPFLPLKTTFVGFLESTEKPGTQLQRSLEILLNGPVIYGTRVTTGSVCLQVAQL